MCRNAVMKVKTSSGIRRFQEDKELGNWFAKLLPVISSMDSCQPQQAIEPGSSSPEINEADKESNIDEINGNEASPDSASSSSSTSSKKAKTGKRKFFVPTPTNGKKSKGQTESLLCEILRDSNHSKNISFRHFFQGYTGFFKGAEPEASCQGRCIFKNNGCLSTTAKPCSPTSEPTNA